LIDEQPCILPADSILSIKKCNGLWQKQRILQTRTNLTEREIIAEKSDESVYKVVEVIGSSRKSWDDAVKTAAGSLRDLRVAEIVKLDMTVKAGKVRTYRARVPVFQVRKLTQPKSTAIQFRVSRAA
jgi:flavin-binding protein dodecin